MRQCKWERVGYDSVPVPFGHGNCSMPTYDCVYEGDIDISDIDMCDENCPAFEEATEEQERDTLGQ